jgi:hypothetical protein
VWTSDGGGSNGTLPRNTVERRMGGDGFPKCIDLILKRSKLKISKREHKEPLLMPLNS